MRITVIPEDRWIRRDGDTATLENWPFDDSGIHAIQWYGSTGEIERKGKPKPSNEMFDDLTLLQPYMDALDAELSALADVGQSFEETST